MNRGVDRCQIFRDNWDRRFFLSILGGLVFDGRLHVHAFCLMDNHFHLLVETPCAELSRWMQLLLGQHAQRFNKRHERIGHLFQGRHKPLLIQEGSYFAECSRYVHLNPVRAGLVQLAEHYDWSSYRNYLGGSQPVDWVATARTLECFEGVADYRQFVESAYGTPLASPREQARAGLLVGDEVLVQRVQECLRESSHQGAEAMRRRLGRALEPASIERIRATVELLFHDCSSCQRRRVLMFALRAWTRLTLEEVGKIVGATAPWVSQASGDVRIRARLDSALAERLDNLAKLVRPERPGLTWKSMAAQQRQSR